jgi:hypothetical protein
VWGPADALLEHAAAAKQEQQQLLSKRTQQLDSATLSTLPDLARDIIKDALCSSFRGGAEALLKQQAAELQGSVIPTVKAQVPAHCVHACADTPMFGALALCQVAQLTSDTVRSTAAKTRWQPVRFCIAVTAGNHRPLPATCHACVLTVFPAALLCR